MWLEMAARQSLVPMILSGSLLAMLAIVSPPILPTIEPAGGLVVSIILLLALSQARRTMMILGLVLALPALFLMVRGGFGQLTEAARSALLLCGFLTALHLLRAVASVSETLQTVGDRCRGQPDRAREVTALVGGLCLGSFLHVAAHALLAPILVGKAETGREDKRRTYGPEPVGEPDHADVVIDARLSPQQRLPLAIAAVRGLSLSALWSPFFVGVVFVVEQVPGASLLPVMTAGLIIALTVASGLVLTAPELRRAMAPAAHAMRVLAGPILVLFPAFLTLRWVTGYSALEVLTIGIPGLLGAALLLMPAAKHGPVVRAALSSLSNGSDEIMIVIAATLLSTTLRTEIIDLADHLQWLSSLAPTTLLIGIIVIMIGLGVLGVHQFISASVILAASYAMPQLDPTDLAGAVIVGWSLAAASSPVGTSIMVASRMFDVPFRRLILGKPLVGTLLIAGYATLVLRLV